MANPNYTGFKTNLRWRWTPPICASLKGSVFDGVLLPTLNLSKSPYYPRQAFLKALELTEYVLSLKGFVFERRSLSNLKLFKTTMLLGSSVYEVRASVFHPRPLLL